MTPRFELLGMTSPNVRKVVIMLEELEAAYATRLVKVFAGEQFTPAFRALNPLSKVPVLIDHEAGQTVFESGAILIYLAEAFGRFLPAAGAPRTETLKWLFVQTSNVGPMLGQYNHFRIAGDGKGSYAYERYRKQSARLYALLDERLGTNRYLAGEAYSIADIATWPWSAYVDIHKMDWAEYPHLARWRAEIGERPAIGRAEAVNRALTYFEADGMGAAAPADIDRFWWRD